MIHLGGPYLLAAVLAGLGTYGALARRNAVLVLIGVELILNAAGVLLVAVGSVGADRWSAGPILTLFVITIAAAEVTVALAIVLAVFRQRGNVDLSVSPREPGEPSRPAGPRPAGSPADGPSADGRAEPAPDLSGTRR